MFSSIVAPSKMLIFASSKLFILPSPLIFCSTKISPELSIIPFCSITVSTVTTFVNGIITLSHVSGKSGSIQSKTIGASLGVTIGGMFESGFGIFQFSLSDQLIPSPPPSKVNS